MTERAQPVHMRQTWALALAVLAAHVLVNATSPYGFHRDEFLYFAMGRHLRLFAMDFPPFIAVLSQATRVFGDALTVIRFGPAIAHALIVVLTAALARELGGGRFAQLLACLAVIGSPLFLRPGNLFQPVVFDQLWWTLALYALVRICRHGGAAPRDWLLLGAALGLGLLTKFIVLVLGFALLLALLLTPLRRALRTPWPWLAAAIAFAIGAPSIVGQVRLGFPVLGQLSDLQRVQLERVTPGGFLLAQGLMLGPAVLLALLGAGWLLGARGAGAWRALGWACALSFAVIMLLRGKPYYVGPVYPALLAAGGAAFERLTSRTAWRGAAVAAIALFGLVVLPMGLPFLPPAPMARYGRALGVSMATTTNTGDVLELPQDYADMLGWENLVAAVARVYHALPDSERVQAVVLGNSYGHAGAIDFFGPRHGLPPAVSPAGSYWFFGPGRLPGDPLVAVGVPPEDLDEHFRSVTLAAVVNEPWVVPEERNVPVVVARRATITLQEIWPRLSGRQ